MNGPDDREKLGFLRVIQLFFVSNVGVSIALLIFVTKNSYEVSFGDFLGFLNLVLDGIAFWLIWQRKAVARGFVIGTCLFNIAISTTLNLAVGSLYMGQQVFSSLLDIPVLIYFLSSQRVKTVLIEPFSLEIDHHRKRIDEEMQFFQLRSWSFWRNIIIYFCVFSVVGHWMEAAYCLLTKIGVLPGYCSSDSQIWSDWFYPFLVYGFGTVACILLFFPAKNFLQRRFKGLVLPLLLTFVLSAVVCSLIELAMGLMLNQPRADGSMPLWNYSGMFCNFMGQICLQNAIAFGIVATFMTWILYPLMERTLAHLSDDVVNVLSIIVVVVFSILFVFYCLSTFIAGMR